MADLRTVTDITIADRLSTKLKNELTVSELTEKIAQLEAELLKFKTDIGTRIDGKAGKYEIAVTVDGKTKTIGFDNSDIEAYINSSNPAHQITVELLEILLQPYEQMLYRELKSIIDPVVANYQDVKAGRKL